MLGEELRVMENGNPIQQQLGSGISSAGEGSFSSSSDQMVVTIGKERHIFLQFPASTPVLPQHFKMHHPL